MGGLDARKPYNAAFKDDQQEERELQRMVLEEVGLQHCQSCHYSRVSPSCIAV